MAIVMPSRGLGRGARKWLGTLALLAVMLGAPLAALAGPRSGGSFGGRLGFRNGGGLGVPRSTGFGNSGYGYGGGSHFFFLPSFGWGLGGLGYGGGFSSLLVLGGLGFAAFSLVRAARRYRGGGGGIFPWQRNDDDDAVDTGRAYVYRLQVALGRSARGIQDRLARFAAEGDTASEAGLASLLQQTALELLREKDSFRYGGADGGTPMSMTNAEGRLNSLALAERARFQVERVRGADGRVRRSEAAAEEGKEALEYVVVTLIVATRTPIGAWKAVADRDDLARILEALGGASPDGLLGLEVVWTPADPDDSMTETDLMTTYPDLRGL